MTDNYESSLSNINLDFSNIEIQESYKIPLSGIWSSIKISGDALYQIACQFSTNGQVFISRNYGLNWTVVQYFTDKDYLGNFADVSISKDGKYMTVLQVNGPIAISSDYGVTWKIIKNCLTKKDQGNIVFDMIQKWYAIDMSGDGKYQTAISIKDGSNNGGYIYISDNYGNSWTDVTPSIPYPPNFTAISMSYSGQYQSIVINSYTSSDGIEYPSLLIKSKDYGLTWTDIIIAQPGFTLYTCCVNKSLDSDIDGKYQYASAYSDFGLYTSDDYGDTWNYSTFDTLYGRIFSLATSSDGQYIYASRFIIDIPNINSINISADYGKTFNINIISFPNIYKLDIPYYNIFKLDISANGSFAIFTNYNNKILFSNNYGETFNDYNDSPFYINIYPVKCSSSGQYQLTFIENDSIIVSNNYGSTWNKININNNWSSCAISLTGQYQSVISNGLLYISNDYGKTWDYTINLIVGDIVKVSGDGQYYSVLATYPSYVVPQLQISNDYGQTFIESPQSLQFGQNNIEISLNGYYQIISCRYLTYILNDYGKDLFSLFSNDYPDGSSINNISCISMSASGRFILIVNNSSPFIYIKSNDYGQTITVNPQVRNDIISVGNCCMSSTGQYQFMSLNTNPNYYIYYSIDYGNTWSILDTSSINYSCQIASVSSNGQSIVLNNQNSIYQIYLNNLIK